MDAQVRVEGLELVRSNLRRVSAGYPREQQSIHNNLGQTILQRARNRARVRTGRMRSLIRLRTTQELVEITSEADYARFQHWGTQYVSADRHLTEPLRELEQRLVKDYQNLTNQYVERVWQSNA